MNYNDVVSNFIWRFLERIGAQTVSLVVSLILARILDPSVYGTVALITAITTILQVFVDSGLGSALIQKKDADNIDFSTVFYFNIFVCLLLYIGMYSLAPALAEFYGKPELVNLIRVLSITLIISGVKNIQESYIAKKMIFKKFFYATLGGTIGAAIIGIWMALQGYGPWALVVLNLFNLTIDTIILWIAVKWRPNLVFSFTRLKSLLSFGWKLLASMLLSSLYSNVRQLLIGKVHSNADLAYYNKGYEIPAKIVPNVVTSINSVLLPTMSAKQDKKDIVLSITRKASQMATFIIWPAMMGLAACGESLVKLLLTEKWLPAVPYLVIFCFDYAMWPIIYTYNNAINAIGRSDVYLRIQTIQKAIGILALLLTVKLGTLTIALSVPVVSMVELMLVAEYVNKLLGFEYLEQMKAILPSVTLALFMGIIVWLIRFTGWSDGLKLIVQIPLGIIVYIIGAKLLKFDGLYCILEIINHLIIKWRKGYE